MRLRKFSIPSKSSTSISWFAKVSKCRGIQGGISTKTHDENVNPRKNDCDLWEYLEISVRRVQKVVAVVTAHHAYALAKGSRKCVENIHSWIEPLSESPIAALRLIRCYGFRFKYGEDGLGRSAVVYFSGEAGGVGG